MFDACIFLSDVCVSELVSHLVRLPDPAPISWSACSRARNQYWLIPPAASKLNAFFFLRTAMSQISAPAFPRGTTSVLLSAEKLSRPSARIGNVKDSQLS